MSGQDELTAALNDGNIEQARVLLNNGVKINSDLDGYRKGNIFDTIIKKKAYDIADYFLKDATIEKDIYEYDSFNNSIFESIIKYLPVDEEGITFLNIFLKNIQNLNSDIDNQTLLGFAFDEGADIVIIKCMVDAGCNVDYKNNADENFIHKVIGNYELSKRNKNKALEYLSFLIHAGVDVNGGNIVKTTPLMLAVKSDKEDYISLLMENGANPNEEDKEGNTAFYYSVVHKMRYTIYDTMAKFTMAKFDIVNKDGEAILPSYLRMVNSASETELKFLERLIQDGGDLTQTSPYYDKAKSSIDWAAEKPVGVLELILKMGKVDINRRDNNGNTILHKVCAYNVNFDQQVAKETYRKVKLLIEQGADISLLNDADETALMIASGDNLKSKTVELLLLKKD